MSQCELTPIDARYRSASSAAIQPVTAAEDPPKVESAGNIAALPTPRWDVNGDGVVDAQDVAWAIYYFNRPESGAVPANVQGKKLDLNGDHFFDAAEFSWRSPT